MDAIAGLPARLPPDIDPALLRTSAVVFETVHPLPELRRAHVRIDLHTWSCERCSLPRGSTRAFFDVEFAHTGWTPMANVTGWAAISLPLGSTADGLPIGVQLMAPEETILLQLAAALEQALPWAGRRPAGWVGEGV